MKYYLQQICEKNAVINYLWLFTLAADNYFQISVNFYAKNYNSRNLFNQTIWALNSIFFCILNANLLSTDVFWIKTSNFILFLDSAS